MKLFPLILMAVAFLVLGFAFSGNENIFWVLLVAGLPAALYVVWGDYAKKVRR